MKAIYLANVGNRDVKYDNEEIKPPRLTGKDYLERFDMVAEHLNFPIIQKGLTCIFEELNGSPLDQLILFYTDQDPNEVAEKHYQSDTLYFAEIIERLVHLHLSGRIREVVKIKISRNPNDYDYTYDFFSRELEKIERELKPDRVFLSPAGGIPACNMNLLLQGSRIFTRRAVTLLIPENPDKPAKLQKLGELINRENNRQILKRLLDEYDFGGAAELLENETDAISRSLLALARTVQYRLYFDFLSALNYLDQIEPDILRMPESYASPFVSLENLMTIIRENLLAVSKTTDPIHGGEIDPEKSSTWLELQARLNAEVLLNAKIKWLSMQYIDFLGRIFRLQEGVLRRIFEKVTNYSADGEHFPNDFETFLQQDPNFLVYLSQNRINGKTPVAHRANRGTLLLFLRYLESSGKDYHNVLKHCDKLDHLAALRNKCALAHGNTAVNSEIITKKYGDVWKNLSALSEAFGLDDLLPQIECIKKLIIENF
ncbi:MAG: hypothetical protein WC602_03970 [archaeon]